MPRQSATDKKLARLEAENKRLKEQLAAAQLNQPRTAKRTMRWQAIAIFFMISIAGALLVAGNTLFWGGRTLIETDRYTAVTGALIKEPSIQTAIATKATTALFSQVDAQQFISDVLPPRADFLAPTLADKLQETTQSTIQGILAKPEFQERWVSAQQRAHDRLLTFIRNYQGDGTIDISDVYKQLSTQLESTKLSFLANKQLPDKIGSITVVDAPNLPKVHWVVVNFNWIRALTIFLFFALSIGAVFLAKNRRRTLITIGILYALFMFAELIAIRIGREIVVSRVDPVYQAAARDAWRAIVNSLAIQTAFLMVIGLLIAVVAWVTGPARAAQVIRKRVHMLSEGKFHEGLFHKENPVTIFIGRHRTVLQWGIVGLAGLSLLIISVSVMNIIWIVIAGVVLILLVELLAAPAVKLPPK